MSTARNQLGDQIPLCVQCKDASESPVAPDAAPTMKIYLAQASPTLILSKQIPIIDRYGTTGLFGYLQPLNTLFSVGKYWVKFTWTAGAFSGVEMQSFDILAGGSTAGQALSMHFKQGAQADFIIRQQDSGNIQYDRNPRV